MTPLPFITRGYCVIFDSLSLQLALFLSYCFRPLIKGAQIVRILDSIGLGELVPVPLTEGQRIVVLEFMSFRRHVFGSRFFPLLFVSKADLGFSDVGDSLNGDNASSFAKHADWRHLASLEGHRTRKLQSAVFASDCTEFGITVFTCSLF